MNATRPRLLLLSLAAAALLAGCPHRIPPPDDAIAEPKVLAEAVDARVDQIESMRLKNVVLDYYGADQRVKVRQLVLVKKPTFLRVQTRAPGTEEIMSLLVSDGTTFALHRRDTNTYYHGTATPEHIARLLPVDLSARDVVRVMLGGAPWDRFRRIGDAPRLEWDAKRGKYRYEAPTDPGGVLSMWVRPTDYAVVEVAQTDADGELVYRYTTDDWKRHGTVALPTYRRFVWPARHLDFSMDVGETQLNVDLPEMLFKFPPPPGSQIVDVDG